MASAAPVPRQRRADPGRRNRIIDSCLEVITEVGVAGCSARRVAAAADVSLGSVTYHFESMDALFHEAFTRFSHTVSDRFVARLDSLHDRDSIVQAIIDTIDHDVFGSSRDLMLTQELYTLAARDPAYRSLTNAWMKRSRAALAPYFDEATARILDALVEGLTIHRALDNEPQPPGLAALAVHRLIADTPSR